MVHGNRKQVGQLTSNTSENPGTVGQRPRATLANHSMTQRFLLRKQSMSTCSLEKLALFLLQIRPAALKRRSDGVLVAGMDRMDLHT